MLKKVCLFNFIIRLLYIDTIFVTFTKKLPDNVNWKVIEVFKRTMSWGDATVYIQIKM